MLALETKQSGGKLLQQSDLRGGGVFLGETSRSVQREMKIGTCNVRSFYRAGSFKVAARELARYKLDVVGVQEVRWDKGGTVRVLLTQYRAGDKVEKNEMGCACGAYW